MKRKANHNRVIYDFEKCWFGEGLFSITVVIPVFPYGVELTASEKIISVPARITWEMIFIEHNQKGIAFFFFAVETPFLVSFLVLNLHFRLIVTLIADSWYAGTILWIAFVFLFSWWFCP